jgi:hypothetical protein
MLFEAETNKYCPGGNDIGAISNLITWVLNFFLSVEQRLFALVVTGITPVSYYKHNGYFPLCAGRD